MQITNYDICGMDNKMKDNNNHKQNDSIDEVEFDEDGERKKDESYNPNWTLRKCASKLLDKLSLLFPSIVFQHTMPILECELQSKEWIKQERAILSLGACGVGCYEFLIPHMPSLISFLIKQIQNSNKFIRAISCWTVSR